MNTPNQASATKTAAPVQTKNVTAPDNDDDEFVDVATERNLHHPKWCGYAMGEKEFKNEEWITGFLVNHSRLKEKSIDEKGQERKAFDVLEIILTKPHWASKAGDPPKEDSEGNTIQEKYKVKAGDVLCVTAYHELITALQDVIFDPDFVYKVKIRPVRREQLKKGKSAGNKMWRWQVKCSKAKSKRAEIAPTTVSKFKLMQQGRTLPQLMAPASEAEVVPDFVEQD